MRRRGFTLIEVGIVCVLLSLSFAALGTMANLGYQSYCAFMRQLALKSDSQRVAESIFRLVAGQPDYRIDRDNHGLTLARCQVRWTGQRLEMRQGQRSAVLFGEDLRDFSVTRREGVLTLNFALETRYRYRSGPVRLHEIYDYPRVGLP